MRSRSKPRTTALRTTALILLAIVFTQQACRKTGTPSATVPTKFTELKIDPSFQFDHFINLDVPIDVPANGMQLLLAIQIFQEDPKSGGKLIATGATDINSQYKTNLRIPSRLKELWTGKTSPRV